MPSTLKRNQTAGKRHLPGLKTDKFNFQEIKKRRSEILVAFFFIVWLLPFGSGLLAKVFKGSRQVLGYSHGRITFNVPSFKHMNQFSILKKGNARRRSRVGQQILSCFVCGVTVYTGSSKGTSIPYTLLSITANHTLAATFG